MPLKLLPLDIINYNILPFLKCKCDFCNHNYFFFDYTINVTMKKYISVFDDNFFLSGQGELHKFNVLCNKCYVHFLNNNYFRTIF